MKSVFPPQLNSEPLEARTGSYLSPWAPSLVPTGEARNPSLYWFESFCWLDSCAVVAGNSTHATEEVLKID